MTKRDDSPVQVDSLKGSLRRRKSAEVELDHANPAPERSPPDIGVSIADMNEAIARQGAEAGKSKSN